MLAKRIDPLTIGPYTFDFGHYDAEGDVLYLSIGPEGRAVVSEETPEGHAISYDEQNRVVGIIVIGAKEYLDRDGMLAITMPVAERLEAPRDAVEGALAATA
jgi:uncharacterized protein YuzE